MEEFLKQCELEVGRCLIPDEYRMAKFFYDNYLKGKTEPVLEVPCSDGLCKPPVNAIKAALWWMDAGLKDADMNKGEYELTRGYKEELEEYLTRLA